MLFFTLSSLWPSKIALADKIRSLLSILRSFSDHQNVEFGKIEMFHEDNFGHFFFGGGREGREN